MRAPKFLRDGIHDLVTPPTGQFPVLDALRTLAVLLVVCGHYRGPAVAGFPDASARIVGSPFFTFGWTGVDLFFVLSGFLIGRQLWREHERRGTVDGVQFVLRRGFRIWPLYFVAALLSPVLTDTWSYRWSDWMFLSNYLGGRVEGGWSLSTEEQFYILMPASIIALARWVGLRRWLLVIPILLVGLTGARHFTARALLAGGMTAADVKQALYFPLHLHSDGLLVGLFIALVATIWPGWVFASSVSQMRRTWAVAGVVIATGVYLRGMDPFAFPFLSLGLIFGGMTTVMLADARGIFKPLHARAFYVVSRLSFGMYLNHFAILRWITPGMNDAIAQHVGGGSVGFLVGMAASVACSLLFSTILFLAIEHPFLRLRGRVLVRRAPDVSVKDPGYTLPWPGGGTPSRAPAGSADRP